jgi:hypothetical protein
MRDLSLIDIQNALNEAELVGADTDQPEGQRYARISETLLLEIAFNLGKAHAELITLREGPKF